MSYIKFLGTAGARIVVARQLRSSAGIWLNLEDSNFYIDPGPGALVKCFENNLDPQNLDAILLSHKHLDHSGDINAMIESMSLGGHEKKGEVFAPLDCLEGDPVIFRYLRGFVDNLTVLKTAGNYKVKTIDFSTPVLHYHGGDTFGFKFKTSDFSLSYISDTKYFTELQEAYKADYLVLSVLLKHSVNNIDHLCVRDAKEIISQIRPKAAILTHFGRNLLVDDPNLLAEEMSKEIGVNVIAASDGMKIDLK